MSAKKRQSSIVDLFKTSNPSSSNNSDPKRLSTASVSSSTVLISSSTASVSNKNISNCSNSTAPSCSISTVSSVQTHIINDIFPPYDLGCLIASIREMPSELRYKVIQNVDKPDQHFIFPYHDEGKNKKRCFQHKWLQDHTWLVYSKSKDGGLCLPCVLFAKTGHRSVGMFVVSALTKFKNATTEFSAHAACDYHRFAMQDFSSFISIMEQRQLSVVQMATTGTARRIQENREKLKSILDTVILCGRQNFALRGHKEGKEEKKCYKVISSHYLTSVLMLVILYSLNILPMDLKMLLTNQTQSKTNSLSVAATIFVIQFYHKLNLLATLVLWQTKLQTFRIPNKCHYVYGTFMVHRLKNDFLILFYVMVWMEIH
jgi:hypothetical protein